MNFKLVIIGLLISRSTTILAFDFGLSTSGNDIGIDIWLSTNDSSKWGYYARGIVDFDNYKNGRSVNVCNDGSISGSTGSGTCSGHKGVSHSKSAEYDRFALVLGPTYSISKTIQIHCGPIIGIYSSDVDIGDMHEKDYTDIGVDFGISLMPFRQSDFKLFVSHETEQKKTFFGLRYPID